MGGLRTRLARGSAVLALGLLLSSCAAIANKSMEWTAKLTGADDPNNTGLLARAGRLQNQGTAMVAGAVGVQVNQPAGAASAAGGETPGTTPSAPDAAASAPAGVPGASAATAPSSATAPATSSPAVAQAAPPQAQTAAAAAPMTVAEMQRLLQRAGHDPGPADGAMGRKTVDALKKFQAANGLEPTGKLNGETVIRLRATKKPG
ncbi:MAG: peptidoglycan-binding protein [Rubrivivax sp.]|nr:peptidoglycan-binding protein [Rubrivivax sp.]